MAKNLEFNPAILSDKATHILHSEHGYETKVKVFMSTLHHDGTITFEYVEGEHKGKWSNNAKLADLVSISKTDFDEIRREEMAQDAARDRDPR